MPPLNLKQEFSSLKSFKQALYVWAIEAHFEPRILKSDSHHVRVGCKFDPKCEFSIRCNAYNASPRVPNPFAKITVLRHEHTCTPGDPTNPLNRQVANRIPWLVENVPRFLDVTPTTTIESIQEAILTHSGYTVNLQQIRRVRRLLVKGKDFRSPQREYPSQHSQHPQQQEQQQSHNSNNGLPSHNTHPSQQQQQQQQQHHSHGVVNPQNVNNGVGGSHSGHSHAHTPSQHTSSSVNSSNNFVTSSRDTKHEPHHTSTASPSLLQVQDPSTLTGVPVPNANEDFTNHPHNAAAAARLANQFEDHSQLITALTDQNQVGGGGGGGGVVQSNNMFEVANGPPPPRIIEAPVSLGSGPGSSVGGRHGVSGSVSGGGGGGYAAEPAQRCPFCVNVRWMRSIKDAVEHMKVHVV